MLPGIFQVDRHPTPGNPGVVEEHLDVRYLVIASPGADPVVSAESDAVRWFDWEMLPDDVEPTIIEMLQAARDRLG